MNAAPLTITANNDSKTYGTFFSSTAFTETGLVNGDTIAGVTETSTGAATSATVGTYPIIPSAATGTGLSNYTIGYVNGTLTVNRASLLSLTVTTLADDPSGNIPGYTTLRDAITQADTDNADQYFINFAPGLQGTIDLTNALPALNNNIAIQGPGPSNLTVQRDSNAAAFSVFIVDSGETINFSGMTIAGSDDGNGGGIYNNSGTLTVNNIAFTDNSANGIYNNGGTLTVNNSAFTGNGTGIANNGTTTVVNSAFTGNYTAISNASTNTDIGLLKVTDSTFINNSGSEGSGINNFATATVTNCNFTGDSSYYGGAILSYGGTLTVSNSTFANDSAACGGGIYNFDGTLTVTNSTFTGDTASQPGGAVCSSYTSAMLTNCTIDGNSAPAGYGGGIWGDSTLNNTIVAGNIGGDIGGGQVNPTSSNNLIGDGTGIPNLSKLNSSNLIGTTANPINPLLGPLANNGGPTLPNGGPTLTMALLPGSPAIDAGSTSLAVDANGNPLTTDQRGAAYPRIINGTVDIGALEQITPTVNVVDNGGTYNATAYAATVTVNGTASLEGVTPTLDYQQYINGAWTDLGANAPINAGSYDVTANFAGSTDYTAAASTVDFNRVQSVSLQRGDLPNSRPA